MKIALMSEGHLDAIHKIDTETNISPWKYESLKSSLEVGHHGLVSVQEHSINGFIIFSPLPPDCHILNIAVDVNSQRSRVGTFLLKKTIQQSNAMKIKRIYLEVRVSNENAITFYEGFGFIKDAIREKYYPGNPREDALLMSLSI
jgi:ribosomal-protein-alanine N-acetyltransferase